MKITAVIVTFNNPGMLRDLLEDLQRQSLRPHRVIVVDNSPRLAADAMDRHEGLVIELAAPVGEADSVLAAMADYAKAMEHRPEEWMSWKARAERLAESGQSDKAILLYTNLLQHHADKRDLWQALVHPGVDGS